jgi:hypothetical protein
LILAVVAILLLPTGASLALVSIHLPITSLDFLSVRYAYTLQRTESLK